MKSQPENYYYNFSATLRISGNIPDMEAITNTLKLVPTHTHKKGELSGLRTAYESDMWLYTVPVSEDEPLTTHLNTLWALLRPHKDYLIDLKNDLEIDIFCGYRSNSGTAGFEVSYEALQIFTELKIPFDISVIVTSSELPNALANAKRRRNNSPRT